jgi:hypothetical protein
MRVDEPLNLVSLAIAGPIEGPGPVFTGFAGNGAPDAMAPYVLPNCTTVIGLVAYNATGPVFRTALAAALHGTAGHQVGKDNRFMPLARR